MNARLEAAVAMYAAFSEDLHPRDARGRFIDKSGSIAGVASLAGSRHLSDSQKTIIVELLKQTGLKLGKLTVHGGPAVDEMASVESQTGDFSISKHAWNDEWRDATYRRWAEHWDKHRPPELKDVPADIDTSFRGMIAHELGHYFDYVKTTGIPYFNRNPEIRAAGEKLSGHTWRAVQELDSKPYWPKGYQAGAEVFADFFQAFVLGKKVPKILADLFRKHGVKPGRES